MDFSHVDDIVRRREENAIQRPAYCGGGSLFFLKPMFFLFYLLLPARLSRISVSSLHLASSHSRPSCLSKRGVRVVDPASRRPRRRRPPNPARTAAQCPTESNDWSSSASRSTKESTSGRAWLLADRQALRLLKELSMPGLKTLAPRSASATILQTIDHQGVPESANWLHLSCTEQA